MESEYLYTGIGNDNDFLVRPLTLTDSRFQFALLACMFLKLVHYCDRGSLTVIPDFHCFPRSISVNACVSVCSSVRSHPVMTLLVYQENLSHKSTLDIT